MIELYKKINEFDKTIIFSNRKMREKYIHEIMMQKEEILMKKMNKKDIALLLRHETLNEIMLMISHALF